MITNKIGEGQATTHLASSVAPLHLNDGRMVLIGKRVVGGGAVSASQESSTYPRTHSFLNQCLH
eukprot:8738151-Pyramimonas_sp.AAC.1